MQNAPEINKENVSRFLCENCGANMVFDPKNGKLTCPYCAHSQEIVADGAVDERPLEDFLRRGMQNLQPMAREAMQVGCSSCGAIVNFTPPETATQCDFCGAKIVAQPKAADPLVAPEGVLPFCVTPPQAIANFNKWLSSLWFAPSALKDLALKLTPNPTSEQVNIVIETPEQGEYTLTVTDVAGKTVRTEKVKLEKGENNLPFNVSNYAAGMYFVKLQNHEKYVTAKLIIE